jgi:hypothetical protein
VTDSEQRSDEQLEALLREARFTAPRGLAARLAARARDPEAGRILFWADVEQTARWLLVKTAAAAVLTAGLALGVSVGLTQDTPTTSADAVTLDQVARLAVSRDAADVIATEAASTDDAQDR